MITGERHIFSYLSNLWFIWIIIGFIAFYFVFIRPILIKRGRINWFLKEVESLRKREIISDEQFLEICNLYLVKKRISDKRRTPIQVMQIIGCILMGVGFILFMASNWGKISDLIQIGLFVFLTFLTLSAGYYLSKDSNKTFISNSLIFISTILLGVTILLTGQTYHISMDSNWILSNWILLLIWAGSIIPVYIIFRLNTVYYLASLLFFIMQFYLPFYTHANFLLCPFIYPAIVFLLLFPLSKGAPAEKNANSVALILSLAFFRYTPGEIFLALIIIAGFLVYFLYEKKEKYLIFSSISALLFSLKLFRIGNLIYYDGLFGFKLEIILIISAIVFLILFILAYRKKSSTSLAVNMAGFLTFFIAFINNFNLILSLFLSVFLYLVSILHRNWKEYFSKIYKVYSFILALISLYFLSFANSMVEVEKFEANFLVYFYVLLGCCLFLFAFNLAKKKFSKEAKYEIPLLILFTFTGLALVYLFKFKLLNVILINLSLLSFSLSLIFYGYEETNLLLYNFGVGIFTLFIVTQYFNYFWSMLNRSLFFMIGGLFLLLCGFFLERKRSLLIKRKKGEQ